MNISLANRPEARFALVASIAGGLLAAVVSVKAILGSASLTAAIGFIFVPFVMAAVVVMAGVWGLALGCVWYALRRSARYNGIVLVLASAIAAGVPAWVGSQVWYGLSLERAVAATAPMGARALERAMADSPWRTNRFFIAAVAQNPAAPEHLLDQLTLLPEVLPEAELYEPLGSLWDVNLGDRKGLAAMRLVALHPNAGARTLERLADGPKANIIISEVLSHPRTPMKVLSRYFDSKDYLVEWGLALNPNLPVAVMERLSTSSNIHTRFNLTYNRATPRAILERLAQDPDATLARHAKQAIEGQR
ncbi:MAG: hypothetical protein FJY55_05080 [Betaproteobacteria bacterium]|nr:hypothetical protein [Betaproteobacteria bacterium]